MQYVKQAVPLFKKLYQLFLEKDASLTEINPLVITEQGEVVAVDAKMTFDNNALFRHQTYSNSSNQQKMRRKNNLLRKRDSAM